jgi:hypothetical protein
VAEASNGWRDGRDPVQRWLRVLTSIVCLVVFVFLGVSPDRGVDDLPVLALALGAVLLLLGYEGLIRLPIIGGPGDSAHDTICPHCSHPYHREVCDRAISGGGRCDCDNRPVRM